MKRSLAHFRIILILTCILCTSVARDAAPQTVSHVSDGDTFKTSDGQTIRIMGIDAPESDAASTAYLSNLILGKTVTLRTDTEDRDKYGRRLAIVELQDGTDVAGKLVEEGYAFVYLKYPCSRNDLYLELEIAARRAGRGMWAGHFNSTIGDKIPSDPSQLTLPLTGSTQSDASATTGQTVYVTRTGAKYHRGGCSYLSKSKIPIALEDAVSRYGPCSKCGPPTVQSSAPNTSAPLLNYSAPSSSSSGQCGATTKKGSRCKRSASAGSSYCWQHGG